MRPTKPIVAYEVPRQRSGIPTLSGTVRANIASVAIGLCLLVYCVAHSWSWDVFLMAPVLLIVLLLQATLVTLPTLAGLLGRGPQEKSDFWITLALCAAGPLSTGVALWRAWSTAHGC